MSEHRLSLIIPAAGSGSRIGYDVPKPFIRIAGKTIIEHTVDRFLKVQSLNQVVIATSGSYLQQTRTLFNHLKADVEVTIVEGGEKRQDSIYNALTSVNEDITLVAVHDAVRPFIKPSIIKKCIERASASGAAIVGVPAKDTIKKVNDENRILETPDRSVLWQAQTPQIFKKEILIEAYQKALATNYYGTDDASLVEYIGWPVEIVEGCRENFKITYPLDLQLAELLLNKKEYE